MRPAAAAAQAHGTTGSPARGRVALIGGGVVGSAVVESLADCPDIEVTGVLVRDLARARDFPDAELLATTSSEFLAEADVVVEVAGGTGGAADLALTALRRNQSVVTANKAALAERWDEFRPHLASGKLHFEAAVMAAVPVIGAVSGGLRGADTVELHAVLNGTCNAILAAMEDGREYGAALALAQRLGLAEADPSLDVRGIDTAHKLSILVRLAFDPDAGWERVAANITGIDALDAAAVRAEAAVGRAVRLVGSVVWGEESGWSASVRPVSLARDHPLVASGGTNALLLRGARSGEVLLRGLGAGGAATASAVVSDVVAALTGRPGPAPLGAALRGPAGPWPSPDPGAEFMGLATRP